jgi:hypothetical protein
MEREKCRNQPIFPGISLRGGPETGTLAAMIDGEQAQTAEAPRRRGRQRSNLLHGGAMRYLSIRIPMTQEEEASWKARCLAAGLEGTRCARLLVLAWVRGDVKLTI